MKNKINHRAQLFLVKMLRRWDMCEYQELQSVFDRITGEINPCSLKSY